MTALRADKILTTDNKDLQNAITSNVAITGGTVSGVTAEIDGINSATPITIETTAVDADITLSAHGTGIITSPNNVEVTGNRHIQGHFLTTPGYLNIGEEGTRIGEDAAGTWLHMDVDQTRIIQLGRDDGTANYGMRINDLTGETRFSAGFNLDLNSYVAGLQTDIGNTYGHFISDGTAGNITLEMGVGGADVFSVDASGVIASSTGTFPSDNGTSGYVLKSDGTGGIIWQQETTGNDHWSFPATIDAIITAEVLGIYEIDADKSFDISGLVTGQQFMIYNVDTDSNSSLTVSLENLAEFFNFTNDTQATITLQRAERVTCIKREDGTLLYIV